LDLHGSGVPIRLHNNLNLYFQLTSRGAPLTRGKSRSSELFEVQIFYKSVQLLTLGSNLSQMMSPNDLNDDANSSSAGAPKIPSAADETPIDPPFPTIPPLTEFLRRFEPSEDHVCFVEPLRKRETIQFHFTVRPRKYSRCLQRV
jgi:hypothetical protein